MVEVKNNSAISANNITVSFRENSVAGNILAQKTIANLSLNET